MCGGYSYFNNAAIAAVHLRGLANHEEKSAPKRIAILDVDFHHGNGTQELFYDSNTVLYVSIHHTPDGAYPYYSGFADERGTGEGEGFNINFPLPSGRPCPHLHFLKLTHQKTGTTESQYTETMKQVALSHQSQLCPAA